MIENDIRLRIEKATVALTNSISQGVLVSGGLIVTAAHCVHFNLDGTMNTEYYIEPLMTTQGPLKSKPVMVEAVNDIAVLGALDSQAFWEEAEGFEQFCENTAPVYLFTGSFDVDTPIDVHVFTHKKTWVKGKAKLMNKYDATGLAVDWEEHIECGTSGGPIVTESGELLGVVCDRYIEGQSGIIYLLNMNLPARVMIRINGDHQG